ncbi:MULTISPECIES: hypothetical protein [Listeria]|uniref:Uncharacterized protein n=1 Tax=Listeria ivanovii subsp. londoniensis TaxID=202752 RepID=A0ABS1G536_LISIV|nr:MULTISPECIES: hypothetical protein [Listeria]EFS04405.1 conserved hypothetical protein [Listeria seeligeri FSL S4-171]MBF2664014.1 hypothetical protein [Listeria seeligeri]MBK1961982.1 hypothetical protein [Listeria ivanovii subsp. londoniensis]MBM5609395.1 hypothetical protein [Listeria ivanovii]MBM5637730.1 hypothetical protein [Listeria ivanovii]
MKLQHLKKLNQANVYEIYSDIEDSESCYVGFIKETYDEFIMIDSYDHEGRFHGYRLIANEQIFKIQSDSKYLAKYNELEPAPSPPPQLTNKNNHMDMVEFLMSSQKNHQLTELTLEWGEDINGSIESVADNLVIINALSAEDFQADGQCFIELDSINEAAIQTKTLNFITTKNRK